MMAPYSTPPLSSERNCLIMSCRIAETNTQGREDFVQFLKQQALLHQYTDQKLKKIVGVFFQAMQLALLNKWHVDLNPLGFLVVEAISRESVTHHFNDEPASIDCKGYSARFRKSQPDHGRVVGRDWLKEIRDVDPDFAKDVQLNDVEARLLFMEWVIFMKGALREKSRIEIRGIGAFNIHQRECGKVYSRHAMKMVPSQGSRYFKFKLARSLKVQLRALPC